MSRPYEQAVIGLDLSLTGSGVALIDWDDVESKRLISVQTFGEKGSNSDSLLERLRRIDKLANQIRGVAMLSEMTPSLAVIETPAYDQATGKSHDRSGLWWEVCRLLDQFAIPLLEVGTSKVKIYGTGKGTVRKDAVMAAAIRRYPDVEIENNNESDAFILAAIGKRLLGEPVDELPQTHLRAMEGLVLP